MKDLLILFIIVNIINVILQTLKTIVTVNYGKTSAALINAVAYAFYTVVIVYTVCDLPLWEKALVVGVCNLIGVYVVKYFEEKLRKDKLWKIDFTVTCNHSEEIKQLLTKCNISYYFLEAGRHTVFSAFSQSQESSEIVKRIIAKYNAKYFVSETEKLF